MLFLKGIYTPAIPKEAFTSPSSIIEPRKMALLIGIGHKGHARRSSDFHGWFGIQAQELPS